MFSDFSSSLFAQFHLGTLNQLEPLLTLSCLQQTVIETPLFSNKETDKSEGAACLLGPTDPFYVFPETEV